MPGFVKQPQRSGVFVLEARFPRVLNLDDSVARLAFGPELHAADEFDLRALGPDLRYLCTQSALRRFRQSLHPADRHRLTFYGSGDFHHLTAELLRGFARPLSLIVFDQHPDWDISSPWACCGSWINSALQMPHIRRVVVVGLGREDLHGWHLLRGNRRALEEGLLELFPASWRIARDGMSYRRFQTVRAQGMTALLASIITRLPTREIYVSVDKDCLSSEWATTNWSAGELELDELLEGIAQLGASCDMIGADVCGEWSSGKPRHPLFRAVSRLDHPRVPIPTLAQRQTNARTNAALQAAFLAATAKK